MERTSKKLALVWVMALVTMGSGMVNISSVMAPDLPERLQILKNVFPLEFAHVSRSITLLIGFALIISSVNMYKRKKRAWYFVMTLAFLSIISHLTKGLDYEEASLSAGYLMLLVLSRRIFTVKSSIPDLRLGVVRFALAMAVISFYGIAGFWFLDQKDFGITFHIRDAIKETLLFLSFTGDPALTPHTRFAHWFLNSLTIISITGISYSFWALFRPVRYRLTTLPRERERAREILQRYGRHTLDYFKLWPDKSLFFSSTQRGFLAYRVGAHTAVVLGDPVGPEDEIEEIIRGFSSICDDNDWALIFHQTLPDFLPVYERRGFKKLKIGDDAIVDLTGFTLEGKRGKNLRHSINRIEAAGIHTELFEPPLSHEILVRLKAVSDEWLRISGRRERGFTLGSFEMNYVRSTQVFAAVNDNGSVQGFVNIIPCYRKGQATIDLMRRKTDAPNGLMDYIIIQLFLYCREQGFETFSLGLSPMSGFQAGEKPTPEERAMHFFFQHMNFLFSFRGLYAYKEKFATHWEPRYIIYRNVLDLPRHALAIAAVSER